MITIASRSEGFRNVLILVSSLSFCYCAAELIIGWWIGSISVLMASVQFLQNGVIGLLSIAAINRPVHLSPATSALLAALIAAPALAALWLLYQKWNAPSVPDGVALTLTAVGALAINAFIAFVFARARGGIDAAALISARTGLLVAAVLLATGVFTLSTLSPWPDAVAALAIFILNAIAIQAFLSGRGSRQASAL